MSSLSNRLNYEVIASVDKKDYKFYTTSGDLYLLYFTDFTLLNITNTETKVLSVGFNCTKNNVRNIYDPRIKSILISLMQSLFEDDEQSILFYICLNNDGKAKYRNRTFNRWFRNNDDFVKHQIIIDDFYCSIILRATHPNLYEIIDAFEYTIKTYWQAG